MYIASHVLSGGVLCAMSLLLAAGCAGDPMTGDSRESLVAANVQLSHLGIQHGSMLVRPDAGVHGYLSGYEPIPGALRVSSLPADREYVMTPGAYVKFMVRTSEGDEEELVAHASCMNSRGEALGDCSTFLLHLENVEQAYALTEQVEAIPARFRGVSHLRSMGIVLAVVTLLHQDADVEAAMRRARQWPGVGLVEAGRGGFVSGGPPPRPWFEGMLPVALGSPQPRDGTVQLQAGTVVTVEYLQPDGSVLRSSATP